MKAVLFDMYETLITHYDSPLYFGQQMAADAGIPESRFLSLWQASEQDRTIGKISLEEILEKIMRKNRCYSEKLLTRITEKRLEAKRECFRHLHPGILPMLTALKEQKLLTGLISNCYSEEVTAIRESVLLPYFDAVYLSCEQGVRKPDARIYERCMEHLSVKPEECLYVGDGGSGELEAARELGITALQAVWYLRRGSGQPAAPKPDFPQLGTPMDIIEFLKEVKRT